MHNINSQIKFKTSIEVYMIIVIRTYLFKILKNCALFTDCITEINDAQIDTAKDVDVVMPMHSLIECSDIYLKISGSLWQNYRDEPTLNNDGGIIDFTDADNNSLNSLLVQMSQTGNDGTKDVEIMVPLKYISNFWRTLEMPLINCEINILICSANCFMIANVIGGQVPTFAITDTKLYIPVVTLSTQDNAKLLEKLKSGFERTTDKRLTNISQIQQYRRKTNI